MDESARDIQHLIEQLDSTARDSVPSIPDAAKAEVRRILETALRQFRAILADAGEWTQEAPASRPIVGRIYAPVGTVQLETDKGIRLVIDDDARLSDELSGCILSVDDDIQRDVPLTTFRNEAHVVSNPPTPADLEALAENIQLRTDGMVLFSPYSRGVTGLPESGQ